MIAPGVGDCSVTKGQHRKALFWGGSGATARQLPELVFAFRTALSECNGNLSSTENKLMNSGGKIFVTGKEPQFPVLKPTVLGVTVTFR